MMREVLRRFVEQVPAAIAMLDRNMRYLAVSRRFLSDHGVTDVIGRGLYEVFPEIPERWNDALRWCLAGAIETCSEEAFTRSDGRVQWLRWEIHPWREDSGEIGGILVFSEDITERKRTEEGLRASEERLRRLLDTDAVGVLFFDYDGTLLGANDVFLRMSGYSRAEVEGRGLHWQDLTPPEWVKSSEEQMEMCATTGRIGPYEKEYFLKDGSRRWMMFAGRDLGDGTIAEYCIDVTDRKTLGDEGRRKDEFLAVLSHELRNPLAAISTALQVLSGGVTPAQNAELVDVMLRQVALMRRLLDDLLDLGRITHGRIELMKEPIDLVEFLHSTAASLQPAMASRRQELLLRLPSESVQFVADRVRLEQIATNLLSNASKYSKPGDRIELSGAREGAEVILRCKDNGQGILPESKGRIFEPFTTLNPRDGDGEASLGIGLTLAKQLTELHGGTISVESGGAGMGSEFTVRLPLLAPSPAQPTVVKSKPAHPSRGAGSVVIVEDNPSVVTAMRIALEQAGHRVHVFADGASALDGGTTRLTPDAVLLDIGLPDMDGYDLAAKMRKRRNMRDALFIAISGSKRRKLRNPDDGFDHYFVKPVDMPEILMLLTKHSRALRTKGAKPRRALMRPDPLRVLLVEDHPALAAATARALREGGLEVETALSGQEALKAAPVFQPQLILCDMNLQDMKGLEVIRRLRSDPSTQRILAVILTAMSEMDLRAYNRKALELGVDAFMSKPLTPERLRDLVSELRTTQGLSPE